MIPTPQRLRANRRWSAVLAAAVGGAVAAAGWAVPSRPIVRCAALGVAAAVASGLYAFGTRIWRRRLRILARPFPQEWRDILERRVAYYRALPGDLKHRFRQLVAVFLDETPITAVGCKLDETCRVLVAASAVIPILGLDAWEYRMLREVLIRRGEFEARQHPSDDAHPLLGMVGGKGSAFTGTLVLSRPDLIGGFDAPDKFNVGIHEFAHLVDLADGSMDGVPGSLSPQETRRWLELVREEMAAGGAGWSDIPEYAFTNEAEFFAVVTEYFFEAPQELAAEHPALYEMLRRIYRQDPRWRRSGR